jgi:hypothetical protein
MAAAGLGPAAALGLLILAPPLYVYLRAQLLQLALLFAGLARGSFESTFRLVSYANASVAPLLVLPFAGDFLFLITGAILESIALRHVHGLTVGRALLAEVLPATVLGVVLLAAGAIGLLWWSQTQG